MFTTSSVLRYEQGRIIRGFEQIPVLLKPRNISLASPQLWHFLEKEPPELRSVIVVMTKTQNGSIHKGLDYDTYHDNYDTPL